VKILTLELKLYICSLLCPRLHRQLLHTRPPQGKRGGNTWRGTFSNNVEKDQLAKPKRGHIFEKEKATSTK
jgi:hypothetical protein